MMKNILLIFGILFMQSCSNIGPEPITINRDTCDFCKMTISNGKFASELITVKGRVYKFDDVSCMVRYSKSNTAVAVKAFYVGDYTLDNKLIPAENSHFLLGGTIVSPMRGNTAAFQKQSNQHEFASQLQAKKCNWNEVYNHFE